MDKNLFNAAVAGDVVTLGQLLEQDPLILDKAALNCEDKNPLHIAAILGNVDFVRAILQVNFSSCCCMCLARDRDGRNPLHLAAVFGKSQVLQELIDSKFQDAALEKADYGGTILHLCVKYNQLATLKILVEKFTNSELLNAKNEDGMTILHQAIYYKRDLGTVRYLVQVAGSGLRYITNADGNTALDLLRWKGHINDGEILRSVAAIVALPGITDKRETRRRQWLEKSKDALMVVASLVATMAFQAGISPPGGVWQDELLEGPNPHRVGEAVMAQRHPKYYRLLIYANTTAFISSLSTIILLFRESNLQIKCLVPLLLTVIWVAIGTIATSYALSIVMVVPKDTRSAGQLSNAGEIVLIVLAVWGGWMVTELFERIATGFLYKASKWLSKVETQENAKIMEELRITA